MLLESTIRSMLLRTLRLLWSIFGRIQEEFLYWLATTWAQGNSASGVENIITTRSFIRSAQAFDRSPNLKTATVLRSNLASLLEIYDSNLEELFTIFQGHFKTKRKPTQYFEQFLGYKKFFWTLRPDVFFSKDSNRNLFGFTVLISGDYRRICQENFGLLDFSLVENQFSAYSPKSTPVNQSSKLFQVNSLRVVSSNSKTNIAVYLLTHYPNAISAMLELFADTGLANQVIELARDRNLYLSDYFKQKLEVIRFPAQNTPFMPVSHNDWNILPQVTPKLLESQFEPFLSEKETYTRTFRKYAKLTRALVFKGGTIISGGGLINTDESQNPAYDFVAGRWDHVVGSHASTQISSVYIPEMGNSIESAIILSSRCDSNWFHWLIETLPRLALVDSLDPDIPVAISSRLIDAAKESLSWVSKRQIIEIDAQKATSIETAYVPGQVIFHPDSLHFWKDKLFSIFDLELLANFRQGALASLGPFKRGNDRIFVIRNGSHRNLFGQKIVTQILGKLLGFKLVDPSALDFPSQVRCFASAKTIVMVGGASMANLIFCHPGTNISVLYPNEARGFDVHEKIGHISGSQVETFYGPSLAFLYKNKNAKKHANFVITPITLVALIRRVVSG